MLQHTKKKTIIYAGPSMDSSNIALDQRFEIKPPIKRGDFKSLADQKSSGCIVILDGVYGSKLAITPTECREMIEAGWTLLGGASMGALRASELWSVGMIGLGDIYNLFRMGQLRSDADVAVSYNKNLTEELTLSIVHVRYILGQLHYKNVIDKITARQLLLKARKIAWFERFPELLLDYWGQLKIDTNILNKTRDLFLDPTQHPKKKDGKYILSCLNSWPWPSE